MSDPEWSQDFIEEFYEESDCPRPEYPNALVDELVDAWTDYAEDYGQKVWNAAIEAAAKLAGNKATAERIRGLRLIMVTDDDE